MVNTPATIPHIPLIIPHTVFATVDIRLLKSLIRFAIGCTINVSNTVDTTHHTA